MKKDVKVYLDDILESITQIEDYTSGVTFQDFEADTEKQDAVIRRFEIIGEAVKQMPKEFISQYPNVAWKQAAGIRDVLIHDYSEVNLERVWNTVQQNLPELKTQIQSIWDSLK